MRILFVDCENETGGFWENEKTREKSKKRENEASFKFRSHNKHNKNEFIISYYRPAVNFVVKKDSANKMKVGRCGRIFG